MASSPSSPAYNALARGQRRHPRARIGVAAKLVGMHWTGPCVIVDVSQTGARIYASEPPRVGATVVVEGVSPELFGTVQWSGRDTFGLAFDMPLEVDEVIRLRRLGDMEPERQRSDIYAYAQRWVTGRNDRA